MLTPSSTAIRISPPRPKPPRHLFNLGHIGWSVLDGERIVAEEEGGRGVGGAGGRVQSCGLLDAARGSNAFRSKPTIHIHNN